MLRICALFLTIGAAVAKQYSGGFCGGVVDFAIDDSTNTLTKDFEAQAMFNNFPRWVPGVRAWTREDRDCIARRVHVLRSLMGTRAAWRRRIAWPPCGSLLA